jgi:hypothetical protein
VLDRVVVDESIEVLRQHTGHCGRATRAGAIGETLDPVVGQAMDPLAQRGVGKVERGGDGVEAMPLDDVTDRLGATEDPGLLRLLQEGSEGRKGVLGKVAFEGPHSGGLQEKVRQKTTKNDKNPMSHYVLSLLSKQSLFASNFPGAADYGPHGSSQALGLRKRPTNVINICLHKVMAD